MGGNSKDLTFIDIQCNLIDTVNHINEAKK